MTFYSPHSIPLWFFCRRVSSIQQLWREGSSTDSTKFPNLSQVIRNFKTWGILEAQTCARTIGHFKLGQKASKIFGNAELGTWNCHPASEHCIEVHVDLLQFQFLNTTVCGECTKSSKCDAFIAISLPEIQFLKNNWTKTKALYAIQDVIIGKVQTTLITNKWRIEKCSINHHIHMLPNNSNELCQLCLTIEILPWQWLISASVWVMVESSNYAKSLWIRYRLIDMHQSTKIRSDAACIRTVLLQK